MSRPSTPASLEALRQVVETPVPVRVILSRRRWDALRLANDADKGPFAAPAEAQGMALDVAYLGLRVDLVENAYPTYGEVVYSDGSRRPV